MNVMTATPSDIASAEDDDAECMSVLGSDGEPITLPESQGRFLVCELFSHRNPDISLAELPLPFLNIFGKLVVPGRSAGRIVRQCPITCAVTVKRLRMEFDGPCHLDCRMLYDLLFIHRNCGEVKGGLALGSPALPQSNAIVLLDGEGEEHPVSLRFERTHWHLYLDQPNAQLKRFSQGDAFLVPESAMNFRRQFGNP